MGRLSYKLASALAKGRKSRRLTREQILVDLLNKRAAARRAGLRELERALREQIRWALPLRREPQAEGGPDSAKVDP